MILIFQIFENYGRVLLNNSFQDENKGKSAAVTFQENKIHFLMINWTQTLQREI